MPHMSPTMMLLPLGVFLALVVGAVLIAAAYFRRPPAQSAGDLSRLLAGRTDRLRISSVRPFAAGGFVILADITGYTRFLSASRLSADHAQFLVLKLLEGTVAAAGSALAFIKIEGDAALFVTPESRSDPAAVAEALRRIFRGFYATRQALRDSNACTCQACRSIGNLELKVAVDWGPIEVFAVNGRVDVSGITLIRGHRLLKLHAAEGPHLVLTRDASDRLEMPWAGAPRSVEMELEGLGRESVDTREIDLAGLTTGPEEVPMRPAAALLGRLARALAVNAGKLRANLRRLGV